jgi:hypothetical protein
MDEKTYIKAADIKENMYLCQRVVDDVNSKIEDLKTISKNKYVCKIIIKPPQDTYTTIDVCDCRISEELLKILITELEAEKSGCEKELKQLQKEFEEL